MKFLTLADWTGMVETELFAQIYKSYGRATVEPFENGRCFSFRVWRAGKPRIRSRNSTDSPVDNCNHFSYDGV